jgi:nucleoside-diphosphate-sugar epimerase
MRALVTGGGGFLGRYIVEKLVARGDAVRALARQRYPDLERLGAEMVQADLQDRDAVLRACTGMDCVFHVAALPLLWGPWEAFHGTNVVGTRNVIDACRARGVGRLVYTSTPSVVFADGDLENADETLPYPERHGASYPATKAMAERAVVAANGGGLLTASLRPHLVWGPRDNHLIPRILKRARDGQLFIVGDGRNKVDITYVENAADAHLLAADRLTPGSPVAGQCYFISQGEPVVLWDFLNRLLERLGLPRITRRIPYPLARALGAGLETVHGALGRPGEPRMTRFLAAQLAHSHWFDIGKARRELGYTPRVSTAEGLDRLVTALQG